MLNSLHFTLCTCWGLRITVFCVRDCLSLLSVCVLLKNFGFDFAVELVLLQ